MRRIWKTLFISALMSLSQLAFAVVVDDLYTATVEVIDQSRAKRQEGFTLALAQVLIKTTGMNDIKAHPGVNDALSQAVNYMVKYAYLPQPTPVAYTSDSESLETDQMPPGFPLSVQFAKVTVDNLMRKLDLPIWPANRPELLVWVVEQKASSYRFVDDAELSGDLQKSFQLRGLPLQLPLYDLVDQMSLSPLAAWSLNQQDLSDAAKRYGVDHWLVVRYSQISSGAVRGSWYLTGRNSSFAKKGAVLNTLEVDSPTAFLSRSVDQVADRFALQMAYFADAEAKLFRLVVENITSFARFSQLNDFLDGLEIVNGVKVRSIEGDTIVLDLAMEGESRVLRRALNKEPRLSHVTQLGGDNSVQSTFGVRQQTASVEYFRWQAAR